MVSDGKFAHVQNAHLTMALGLHFFWVRSLYVYVYFYLYSYGVADSCCCIFLFNTFLLGSKRIRNSIEHLFFHMDSRVTRFLRSFPIRLFLFSSFYSLQCCPHCSCLCALRTKNAMNLVGITLTFFILWMWHTKCISLSW